MPAALVFVPVSTAHARALWRGEPLPAPEHGLQAFTATAALLETLGAEAADDEGVERTCMLLASLWGLARHGERLVLVAEVQPSALRPDENRVDDNPEAGNGGVWLAGLVRAQVQSFFTDDPADPLPGRVAPLVAGLGVDQAWELDEVQQLLARSDLLWHAVEELAVVGEDV